MNSSAVPEERLSYQNIGLIAGPLVFAVMMLLGIDQAMMPEMAWRVAAVGLWMGIWWATEAIPVPATAFLPLVCFDLLGIAPIAKAAQSYAHPIIYLFLGAFILALAVERWNLHKRIALMILSQTGTDGARLILGFMVVAAVLSMWMTNTSTTMMLMPIAVSVAAVVTENMERASERDKRNFQIALLLGLAYAATIGGLATLVGTPPNILLAGFLVDTYGIEISFLNWMLVGVPVSIVLLPLAWLILTRWAFAFDIPESEVATPPNAIVFASGFIRIPDMVRAGFYLNLVSMVLLTIVAIWLAPMVLS